VAFWVTIYIINLRDGPLRKIGWRRNFERRGEVSLLPRLKKGVQGRAVVQEAPEFNSNSRPLLVIYFFPTRRILVFCFPFEKGEKIQFWGPLRSPGPRKI
jgi:hypothetical protein